MDNKGKNLEISFEITYVDIRRMLFGMLYNKMMFLIFGLLPVTLIIVFEIIMYSIGYFRGFSFEMVLWMIVIPSLFILFVLIFPLATLITTKIEWKRYEKFPKNKLFVFNKDEIKIDDIYIKYRFYWGEITDINMSSKHLIKFNFKKVCLFFLPKRTLEQNQQEVLFDLIKSNLKNEKVIKALKTDH